MKKIEGRVRIGPGSRVAAMTGHATPELERELIARGASIVLRKSVDMPLVFAVLRNHGR